MRLEWINEDKTITSYRVEFQTEYESSHWSFMRQYKTFEDAQKKASEFAKVQPETTKIRIVKYTQIIETLETCNGNGM